MYLQAKKKYILWHSSCILRLIKLIGFKKKKFRAFAIAKGGDGGGWKRNKRKMHYVVFDVKDEEEEALLGGDWIKNSVSVG